MQALLSLFVALSLSQTAPSASTGRIAGRVILAGADSPVAGARVMLIPAGLPSGPLGLPPLTTTDQEGRFAFEKLAPGEYHLDAQKTGLAPLNLDVSGHTIHLAAGQTVEGISMPLQRGGVIAGRVFDASGSPLADTRIMALRRVTMPAGSTDRRVVPAPMSGVPQTNDLGEFRLSGLPPGEYLVAAMPGGLLPISGPGSAPRPPDNARTAVTTTFYPGTTDQAAAQVVVVGAGGEVGNIAFTMQSAPAFHVSGLVVDEGGQPVARAIVMLMGDPRSGAFIGPAATAQTQDDGRFVMGEVSAGTYRVTATTLTTAGSVGANGGSGGAFASFSLAGGIERPTEVVVADTDVIDVRVVVRRPPQ